MSTLSVHVLALGFVLSVTQHPLYPSTTTSLEMDMLRAVCDCLPCFRSQNLVINGRPLRIEKLLGEGGFSYVYLVQDHEGQLYALKKIRCPFGAESISNAMREVEATKLFNSPLVITQVDYVVRQEPDGSKTVYILLPYYRRGTLQDRINQCAIEDQHIPEDKVRGWARAIAKSLRVMHRHRAAGPSAESEFAREDEGLLDNAGEGEAISLGEVVAWAHRDVKPANVMIDDNGRAVLMDLGSCSPAVVEIQSRKQALELQDLAAELCTLPYRAPELLDVKTGSRISEKVDIWSYGCTIYALMYLISPFEKQERDAGATLSLAIQSHSFVFPETPAYSQELKDLVDKCLTTEAAERPTVDDILDMLDEMT